MSHLDTDSIPDESQRHRPQCLQQQCPQACGSDEGKDVSVEGSRGFGSLHDLRALTSRTITF